MDQVHQLRKNPPRPTRAVLRPLCQTKAPKAEANAVLAETEDVHMRACVRPSAVIAAVGRCGGYLRVSQPSYIHSTILSRYPPPRTIPS
jgi:hypothetical protein